MHEDHEQHHEKKLKSKLAVVSQFVYKSLGLGALPMITSCDLAAVGQSISDKYSHHGVYICRPSGFWQKSHCALKV